MDPNIKEFDERRNCLVDEGSMSSALRGHHYHSDNANVGMRSEGIIANSGWVAVEGQL
jgi:hypothetical protein